MKKTLFSFALMLAFSAVMLFGTTYAWFSDELVVEDNVVVLGKLDMDVTYGDPLIKGEDGQTTWYEFTDARHLFEVTKDNYGTTIQPGSVIKRQVKVENKGNIIMAVKCGYRNMHDVFNLQLSVKYNGYELQGNDTYVYLSAGESLVFDATVTVPDNLGNDLQSHENYFDFYVNAEQLIKIDPAKVIYPTAN